MSCWSTSATRVGRVAAAQRKWSRCRVAPPCRMRSAGRSSFWSSRCQGSSAAVQRRQEHASYLTLDRRYAVRSSDLCRRTVFHEQSHIGGQSPSRASAFQVAVHAVSAISRHMSRRKVRPAAAEPPEAGSARGNWQRCHRAPGRAAAHLSASAGGYRDARQRLPSATEVADGPGCRQCGEELRCWVAPWVTGRAAGAAAAAGVTCMT